MAINREELEKKIAAAKDPAEIVSILHTAGNEITAEEAKQFFEKVQERKKGKILSLDEMEAVSGGRDWVTEGCAATVEWGSDCWGTDGGCIACNVLYTSWPCRDERCPKCGAMVYFVGEFGVTTGFLQGYNYREYICRKCGTYRIKDDGTLF